MHKRIGICKVGSRIVSAIVMMMMIESQESVTAYMCSVASFGMYNPLDTVGRFQFVVL